MKKFFKYFFVLAIVPALLFNGCKKDDDDTPAETSNFATLKAYMTANNMDLPALLTSWTADAKKQSAGGIVDTTDYSIPGYYVVDIRTAAEFATGHIRNAQNTTLANVVDFCKNMTDKPILVVCKTGQTAGHAVMALRLSGHADAKVLKFGMAGWHADFSAPWTTNKGNIAVGSPNWVTTAAPALGSYSYPTWTSTTLDGAALLKERVNTMLTTGFSGETASNVLANPANWDIYNYWTAADYTTFGHFAGAYQLGIISLAGDEIKAINPAKASLVYCWTGMTSSMVTSWLNILGYNTKGVLYGANALIYDQLLAANKTVYKNAAGFAYVTGK